MAAPPTRTRGRARLPRSLAKVLKMRRARATYPGDNLVGAEMGIHPRCRCRGVTGPHLALVGSDRSEPWRLGGFTRPVAVGISHRRCRRRAQQVDRTRTLRLWQGLGSRLAFSPLFLEPISFVMSRKMLVTIAALAADRECNS